MGDGGCLLVVPLVETIKAAVMRFPVSSTPFLLAWLLWSSPGVTHEAVGSEFDLVCQGQVREANWATEWNKSSPQPATLQIRVDLQRDEFCIDKYCDALNKSSGGIEYSCTAEDGQPLCGSIASTAGPFVRRQTLTFDRETDLIHRSSVGMIGDRGSRPFRSDFDGVCSIAPFTGLSSMSRQ